MPIQNITELFVFDDRDFVNEAYRNLLKREPDKHGLAYYQGRLAQGHGKAAVITQLAQSPECRRLDEIKGLKELIAVERRAQHWFWGLFGYRQRLEKKWQIGLNGLALHNQQRAFLLDALGKQENTLSQIAHQIEASTLQRANWQVSTTHQEQSCDDAPKLPSETVRQCFVDILGREPESEATINHHASLPSREALRENLIHSEEFQHKILALPEHARLIFKRQIQQQIALQGA
jgi:hypothetical protein